MRISSFLHCALLICTCALAALAKQDAVAGALDSAASPLKATTLMDGRLSVDLPSDFGPMTKVLIEHRYPSARRPKIIWCDPTGAICFVVKTSPGLSATADDKSYDEMLETLTQIASTVGNKVITSGRKKIAGRDWVYVEFTSQAADGEYYNLMYGTLQGQEQLFSSFNCPQKLRSTWKPVAARIMASLRVEDENKKPVPAQRSAKHAAAESRVPENPSGKKPIVVRFYDRHLELAIPGDFGALSEEQVAGFYFNASPRPQMVGSPTLAVLVTVAKLDGAGQLKMNDAFVDLVAGIYEKDPNVSQFSNTMTFIKDRRFARIDINTRWNSYQTREIHLATIDGDTVYIVSIDCLAKGEEAWRQTLEDIANSIELVAPAAH